MRTTRSIHAACSHAAGNIATPATVIKLTLNDNAGRTALRIQLSTSHSAEPWTLQKRFVDNIHW